jgi:hypothetical protein
VPVLLGLPEALRDFQLQVGERHGSVGAKFLGCLSRQLIRFLVARDARVSLDPGDICRPGMQLRNAPMDFQGVLLAGAGARVSIALVESEWMTSERLSCLLAMSQARALSIAVISASQAVCRVPKDSLPWAMMSPAPSASAVITHLTPVDRLKEPSV